ncbi:hypothetical protein BJY26_000357 [Spelaeicoccus albus]|uniref:Uncharacterized protein n=1 Tax=Spelaeicoccus albus TaxID=1280376 RepID=A0A7Z0ABD9_9MICO|nr:hypothetical protein [Spelaeicoccus albus]
MARYRRLTSPGIKHHGGGLVLIAYRMPKILTNIGVSITTCGAIA